jgi:hypothetical protein
MAEVKDIKNEPEFLPQHRENHGCIPKNQRTTLVLPLPLTHQHSWRQNIATKTIE